MLKACILGYGGIARSHHKGYDILKEKGAPIELVGLCDIDEKQFESIVSINNAADSKSHSEVHTYTDLDKMLEAEKPDVIDICLPTYLHCEYAVKLLNMGYNVQCEKPMGLSTEECNKILDAANKSHGKLMIGMCLRFDACYMALKDMIDSGDFGNVNAAFFTRMSGLPRWGYDGWFRDYNRAGGVALDMHIHDIDMIRYLFGEPMSVSAIKKDAEVKHTTVVTNLVYPDKIVNAIGDWGMSNSWKFSSGYRVNFEKASVVCEKGVITVYPNDGEPYVYEYEKSNHMANEIEYFAKCILGECENTKNTPEDAAKTVTLVEKIKNSAENGGKVL